LPLAQPVAKPIADMSGPEFLTAKNPSDAIPAFAIF
jgi:hypothetical protein